jgi:hypothetical protein
VFVVVVVWGTCDFGKRRLLQLLHYHLDGFLESLRSAIQIGMVCAVVMLPGLLPIGMRDVGDMSAVGREGRVLGNGERNFGGQSAFGDGVEVILEVYEAVAPRVEQGLLAVGSPAGDILFGGMIGQAARNTAGGRDDENITVTVEIAGEGDQGAVGREIGRPSMPAADVRRRASPPSRPTIQRSSV